MAARKFINEEERNKFIIEVADYFIENNSSTRKTADKFNISNFTTYEYITSLLGQIDINRYLKVGQIISSNKSTTKYGSDIESRLNDIYTCIVINNMNILDTSKKLGVSTKTIYNDILKLDKKRFEDIKKVLSKHSMENSPYL